MAYSIPTCTCLERTDGSEYADVFVPYVDDSNGGYFEFRYPIKAELCDDDDRLTSFLDDKVLGDLDKYIRHLLPFHNNLRQLTKFSTITSDIDEEKDCLLINVLRYLGKKAQQEKTFTFPLKAALHERLNLTSMLMFCLKKKSGKLPTSAKKLIFMYKRGIGNISCDDSARNSIPRKSIAHNSIARNSIARKSIVRKGMH